MTTTHPTLYVLQYGNVDMEEDTFSCLVESINLKAAIESEIQAFIECAEDCDMENYKVYSKEVDGDIFVYLEDDHDGHKRVTEWQRFTKAVVADFK